MKKIVLTIGIGLLGLLANAQNGLERVIVEKYYISNQADSVNSLGNLPAGSVTYRIYVDMLPGYNFQYAYGDVNHELRFETTTSFFNNEDRGATSPDNITFAQAKANSLMLDSWISAGAACKGYFGVQKSKDNGINTIVNADGILANNDPLAGIPLTQQDGMVLATTSPKLMAVTSLGIDNTILQYLDVSNTTVKGQVLSANDGGWAALGGSVGPDADNIVLIAQLTTNGTFSYKLNLQIGKPDPTADPELYVVDNPIGTELSIASLKGIYAPIIKPVVSITSPANQATAKTGDVISITANATDDGTVTSVEFFVDGVSIGSDATAPYAASYTAVQGSHTITALATDNDGAQTTTSVVNITVNNPALVPPVVSLTSPLINATAKADDIIALSANATDDGTITKVEFFVDGVSVGSDVTAPYTVNYTGVEGTHSITATATDNDGAKTTSTAVSIVVSPKVGVAIESKDGYSVYPNPTTEYLNINFSDINKSEKSHIQLYNVIGNLVYSKQGESQNEKINVASFAKGIYFLVISANGQNSYNKIIIK
jgi:chitodextrinase